MIKQALLFADTEIPGNRYPVTASNEIKTRYSFAIPHLKNKKVVEFGPGGGSAVIPLAEIAKTYHGVEINKKNYQNLIEKYEKNKKISFSNMAAEDYFGEDVDAIVAFAMIYYCDFHRLLDRVCDSLNRHGIFIFCQTNRLQLGFKPSRNTNKYYTIEELNDIFNERGLHLEVYRKKINFFSKVKLIRWFSAKLLPRIKVTFSENLNFNKPIKLEKFEPYEEIDIYSRIHYFIAKKL